MLEPRVVAPAPASPVWKLGLSYESESMNLEGMVASPLTAVRNNTSTLSTNGEDSLQQVAMEDEGITYGEEGIGNEDAVEHHQDTPIEDEFLALARTLQSLGQNRVQELVYLL
jgi:hypothetical protein